MSKNQKMLTPAQKRANARNQLFRQIHGGSLSAFICRAVRENAITNYEHATLLAIEELRDKLISKQFEGSKEVGLNPRRRCSYCNNIAHYRATIIGKYHYLCNSHKEQAERDNKQNINGEWMVTDIHKINPYE